MTLMRKVTISAVAAGFAALFIAGCGSSNDGTPAGTAGVSKGVITAKGSITVNGIRFDTTGAAIRIDDNPGAESDLKLGMVVKVKGTSDDSTRSGRATEIEFEDSLEGQIESIDSTNKTITVMGQVVRIEDNVTRFTDDTVKVLAGAGLLVNDFVEVSGFPDDNGGLRATRVQEKASGEFEIKGFVVNLSTGSFGLSLTPGGTATLTVNFTVGTLPQGVTDGAFVEVKSAAAPVAGAITASLIQLEDNALGGVNEKVEVEGLVTSGTVDDFIVNGQRVITNSATRFEGGVRGDFAVGMKLEAEGPLNGSGAIVATKISFRSNIKIEADATAFTSGTSITVLGKTFAINGFTRIDNGPIAATDHVEVRGFADADGNFIAARIVKLNSDTRAFLQGPVTAKDAAAGTLTILGSTIATNGAEFRISTNSSDVPVGKDAFFAQVTPGVTVVKVRWNSFTNIGLAVNQAEIQLGN